VAAPRNRKHIIVPGKPTAEPYKPHGRKIVVAKPPAPASRAAHGKALKQALESAVVEAHRRRADAGIQVHGAAPGLYVQFESQPDLPLKLSSLEDARQGIELVAVSHAQTEEAEPRRIERATVFVPEGKVKHFVTRFESYAKTTEKATLAVDYDSEEQCKPKRAVKRLPFRRVTPKPGERWTTCVPFVELAAAAGAWGPSREGVPELSDTNTEWITWDDAPRFTKDMFVARVHGRSMEPAIADGAACFSRLVDAPSSPERAVLVRHGGTANPETGGAFTVKRS
jgi:hypothetical protein